jgi:hypothetical protein
MLTKFFGRLEFDGDFADQEMSKFQCPERLTENLHSKSHWSFKSRTTAFWSDAANRKRHMTFLHYRHNVMFFAGGQIKLRTPNTLEEDVSRKCGSQ